MTHQVANKIYREVPGVLEVYVWLLSQIGAPIDQPKIAAAQIVLSPRARRAPVERRVRDVLDRELSEIGALTQDLAEGRYPVV
jgi:S-adenosylmethionine synthetase